MNLPRCPAGTVQCEIHLNVDEEGMLEVLAKDLITGTFYETVLDKMPEHFVSGYINNDIELDPIEAERCKRGDYELVYELEKLDERLDKLDSVHMKHEMGNIISEKLMETKAWIYENRRRLSVKNCNDILDSIKKFLKSRLL